MDIMLAAKEIVAAGKELDSKGLVKGTGGNLSIRVKDMVISTPSGYALGNLTEEALTVTDLNGNVIAGQTPTKELPMHLAVYRKRSDLHAVVHTHSTYAVTYACMAIVGNLIPVYIPSMAAKVGPVKLLPFAMPGSDKLGELVEQEILNYKGLLLENHGVLIADSTLSKAVGGAFEIEDNLTIDFLSSHKARELPPETVRLIAQTYGT